MAAEPARPEPVLRNGRGHNSERPVYRKEKKKLHYFILIDFFIVILWFIIKKA